MHFYSLIGCSWCSFPGVCVQWHCSDFAVCRHCSWMCHPLPVTSAYAAIWKPHALVWLGLRRTALENLNLGPTLPLSSVLVHSSMQRLQPPSIALLLFAAVFTTSAAVDIWIQHWQLFMCSNPTVICSCLDALACMRGNCVHCASLPDGACYYFQTSDIVWQLLLLILLKHASDQHLFN